VNYQIVQDDNWFRFTNDENSFSFHYYVSSRFLFIDKFVKKGEFSFLDIFIDKSPELVPDFHFFFQTMFNEAEKRDCVAVFTSLLPSFTFALASFKREAKLQKLQPEGLRILNDISPLFSKNDSYHYFEFEEKFVTNIITSFCLLNYHVLRDFKREIELFDSNDHSVEIYCGGYHGHLSYEVKKDGLYLMESGWKESIKIPPNSQSIKERLLPLFEKMKGKGRILNLLNDEYYFAKLYFGKHHSLLKNSMPYIQMLEILSKKFTKYEIEVNFWKNLNFQKNEVERVDVDGREFHVRIFNFYFILNDKTKTLDAFETEQDYRKTINERKKPKAI